MLNTAGSAGTGTAFYFDYKGGKYGFNTSASRGADTFNPFNQMKYPLEIWLFHSRGAFLGSHYLTSGDAKNTYILVDAYLTNSSNYNSTGTKVTDAFTYSNALKPKTKVACKGVYRKDTDSTWTSFNVSASTIICTATTSVCVLVYEIG